MSRMFDGKTLDQFREDQRKAAIEAHEARRAAAAEREAESRREQEETRKPLHDEMKDRAARMSATINDLNPGDPRAPAVLRSCCMELLEIVGYVLAITGEQSGAEATQ